jgi:hypothetical protein
MDLDIQRWIKCCLYWSNIVDYLVVAGGGGGGSDAGGGGGAGGFLTGSGQSITPASSYSITVGAGGRFTSPVSIPEALMGLIHFLQTQLQLTHFIFML